MRIRSTVHFIFRVLRSRLALNIYFWAFALWLAFNLNYNNDQIYHYGITSSAWYVPVMLGMLFIQCTLVYTNNLLLVPRLLARGKRWHYALGLSILIVVIATTTTVLLKVATPHLNTAVLQHPGFSTTELSNNWSIGTIANEAINFALSDLVFIFAFTAAWYMQDYSRQQKALRLSEQARAEAELAFLKNQINPHFLFNTLNNIYGLTLKKSDAAPDAILKLSAMLRYLLYESSAPLVAFQKEKSAIEAYAEIESLRLPDDANILISLWSDRDYLIPPLLWLPILENAFKHGTKLIGTPVMVDFKLRIEEARLSIACSNYYDSAPSNTNEHGIGLTNLRKRLELLYGGKYSLNTSTEGNTFTVRLKINLA